MTTTSPSTGTTPRRRTVVLGALAALAVLGGGLGALAASHPENAPPPGGSVASVTPAGSLDSVGRIDGSTALVAVLADGDQVTAYVCDGDTVTGERFSGTALGGRTVLHSDGGAELTVDLADGGATGTFTPAGATAALPFRTVPSTGEAGWYTAEAPDVAANWVVLADGTQTGVDHIHKRKHRGHHLKPKPGKPSGVSPTVAPEKPSGVSPTAEPETALVNGFPGCTTVVGRLCVDGDAADPVEVDDGLVVLQPGRVRGGGGGGTDLLAPL
ncbi:hypothetical protein [Pseudonocardia charpentierae]|uniref:Serine/threonine protein kinase n=1 Tax=Pseudonocardia charpentierae TaxID=3075545 RepID=A0ABU2N5B6_9PSEU|nr:hypothetical protein [Pseudonocardia sp. DSM 45834]MDT0349131.1 hypothetical protein [Pseudonocardia sp. DSM 45834]